MASAIMGARTSVLIFMASPDGALSGGAHVCALAREGVRRLALPQMTLGMACQLAGDMNRFRLSVIGAALVAGQTLVAGCSPAEETLPLTEVTGSGSSDKTGSSLDGNR